MTNCSHIAKLGAFGKNTFTKFASLMECFFAPFPTIFFFKRFFSSRKCQFQRLLLTGNQVMWDRANATKSKC